MTYYWVNMNGEVGSMAVDEEGYILETSAGFKAYLGCLFCDLWNLPWKIEVREVKI